jgi:hypothetical protein
MSQQIVSFEELYDHIQEDGIYLCEDLHTSYWPAYEGGYKNKNSFIEYSKNFIDYINAWHVNKSELPVNDFTRKTYALHYYDSILVIEKRAMKNPVVEMRGEIIIPIENFPVPETKKRTLVKVINKIVRILKRK